MSRLILAAAILLTAAPAFAQLDDWQYPDRRDGVHLRILNDYELPAGATSREPIVIIAGSATINGRAEDDVVVVGGTLRVGPKAVIRGDVVAIGGEAIIDPAARFPARSTRRRSSDPTGILAVSIGRRPAGGRPSRLARRCCGSASYCAWRCC